MIKIVFALVFVSNYVLAQSVSNQTAVEFMGQHDYLAAQKILRQLVKKIPSDQQASFNLGVCSYQLKDFNGAAEQFDRTVSLHGSFMQPALYYAALSYFNLNMNAEALRRAQKVSTSSEFKLQAVELTQAIQKQVDENFQLAEAAFANYDDEQCLVLLHLSVLEDHPKGVQLRQSCQQELDEERKNEEDQLLKHGSGETLQPIQNSKNSQKPYDLYLFAAVSGGYDNNIYTTEVSQTGRALNEVMLGFEYLYKTNFDIGLGASYDYNDVLGVKNYQDSYINAYIPVYQ